MIAERPVFLNSFTLILHEKLWWWSLFGIHQQYNIWFYVLKKFNGLPSFDWKKIHDSQIFLKHFVISHYQNNQLATKTVSGYSWQISLQLISLHRFRDFIELSSIWANNQTSKMSLPICVLACLSTCMESCKEMSKIYTPCTTTQ